MTMDLPTLLKRLGSDENLEIEFKSAAGGLPLSIWETVSAFANTYGGWIILGIAANKKKRDVEKLGNPPALVQEFTNLSRNPQKISRPVCGPDDVKIEQIDGSKVIVIRIPAVGTNEKPVYINGNPYTGTYVRRNEGDYRCTKDEVTRMIRDAGAEKLDSTILVGFDFKDLDRETLARYRQNFRQLRPGDTWNSYDDWRFLEALRGVRKDRETGKQGLTRAAVLMFGSKQAIFNLRPRHLIDFRLVSSDPNSEERWEHRIAWEGNLFDAFFQIYPRLVERLKVPFKLEGPHRLEETPAHEALREALVNLLVHADYSEPAALLIKASPHEFVFRNPGASRVSSDDLMTGDRSDPRNPVLLRMFRLVALADEAGTGFPKIFRIWRDAGLELPSITNDTERYEFSLSLRLVHLLSEEDRAWLAGCAAFQPKQAILPGIEVTPLKPEAQLTLMQARKEGHVNNASIQALTGLHRADVTDLLFDLKNRGLFKQQSYGRWATYYLTKDAEKLISTTHTVSTNVLTNVLTSLRSREAITKAILKFCTVPKSASEIANHLKKNPVYLRNHYLNRLIKSKALKFTNPKSIHSPNQKYTVRSKDK